MRPHSYTFPRVNELLPLRFDARPPERPSQRDLVAASLLMRPPKSS